jgi:hypothetical protein|tara:strand:- start:2105 stop:2869 length:765 start_codon:yes stop_codon:yes gene_type:complete
MSSSFQGPFKSTGPEVLNFVITGPPKCGTSALQTALATHPRVVCHAELLAESNAVRRSHHEEYFGPSGNTPDWLVTGHISGEQYLTNKIFDNPLSGESFIGVTVLYPHIHAYDLWDYLTCWCQGGDFCLVQVKRNPVACFIALENERRMASGLAYRLDINELISFVRMQLATDAKVARLCGDRLEINYSELVNSHAQVVSGVFDFIGVPPGGRGKPGAPAGSYRDFERVPAHWQYLREKVPSDVQQYFDPEEFI